MGVFTKLTFVLLALAVGGGVLWNYLTHVPPLPHMETTWWGAGKPRKLDETIRPFKINISNEVLEDLNDRLELVSITPPMEAVNFEYGMNTDYLKLVIEFWRNKYNWRQRETFLNSFPQFKTNVDGLSLHYIHVKPKQVPTSTRVLPLLILHGWPGSVREFYEIIPLLTTPRKGVDYVFEVIAPSLPGYGFSEGASQKGLGAAEVAVVMKNLMKRIGHSQFYVQGGDWGAVIGSNMAALYPDHVLGYHSNMCGSHSPMSHFKYFIGSLYPSLFVDEAQAKKMYPVKDFFSFLMLEFGYMHLQATKPDTVGVALRDSPAGLAAYILEKFSTWTNSDWRYLADGGLLSKYKMENLLDNVMVYWVSGSITTSMRLYSETFNKAQEALGLAGIPVKVPTACALFPHELMYQPECIIKDKFPNLVQLTHMARGGHFAAFEEPALLADDIWTSIISFDNFWKQEVTA